MNNQPHLKSSWIKFSASVLQCLTSLVAILSTAVVEKIFSQLYQLYISKFIMFIILMLFLSAVCRSNFLHITYFHIFFYSITVWVCVIASSGRSVGATKQRTGHRQHDLLQDAPGSPARPWRYCNGVRKTFFTSDSLVSMPSNEHVGALVDLNHCDWHSFHPEIYSHFLYL